MSPFAQALAGAALALTCGAQLHAATPCRLVDSFQDFLSLSAATDDLPDAQRTAAFRRSLTGASAALYTPAVLSVSPGPRLDALALAAMAQAAKRAQWRAADAALTMTLPQVADRFSAAFPDFRCDFPIYLTASFGLLDGAGRVVAGRPALVLGVDTISAYETPSQLPVFLTHELFHRYHDQVAGFSDDLGARDLLWRTLWAEGLATYVSAALNPSNPRADAFLLPRDLEARAKPVVAEIAAQLIPALDRSDPRLFARLFLYGDEDAARAGLPWRSGYYLGYRVAEDLARRHSLADLPHLSGPRLRQEIGEALARLAAPPRD